MRRFCETCSKVIPKRGLPWCKECAEKELKSRLKVALKTKETKMEEETTSPIEELPVEETEEGEETSE